MRFFCRNLILLMIRVDFGVFNSLVGAAVSMTYATGKPILFVGVG